MKEELESKRLSESEWVIMKIFWDKGSMALGDVVQELKGNHGWAYTTVKTLVRRMAGKGWLSTRMVGGSFLYSPAVERSKAVRQALKEFSSRVLDGMLSPVVTYFAEEENINPEDLKELALLLEQYQRKGRKG